MTTVSTGYFYERFLFRSAKGGGPLVWTMMSLPVNTERKEQLSIESIKKPFLNNRAKFASQR